MTTTTTAADHAAPLQRWSHLRHMSHPASIHRGATPLRRGRPAGLAVLHMTPWFDPDRAPLVREHAHTYPLERIMPWEKWRPLPGWEGLYWVSDHGRVWSVRAGRALACRPDKDGYRRIDLKRGSYRLTRGVHQVVARAFHGAPGPGLVTCHNDGDHLNNTAGNVRWDTRAANARDSVKHGTHANANKTHCPRGHAFTTWNTLTTRGRRVCRACDRARQHRSWHGLGLEHQKPIADEKYAELLAEHQQATAAQAAEVPQLLAA